MMLLAAKTMSAWLAQARRAQAQLEAAGATSQTTLIEMADIDYQAFCLLVEALYALDFKISQRVLDRAQMRPLEDLL